MRRHSRQARVRSRCRLVATVLALLMTGCAKRETLRLEADCTPAYPGRTESVLASAVRVGLPKYRGRAIEVTSQELARRVAGGERNFIAVVEVVRYRHCIVPSHIIAVGGVELGDGGWGPTLIETEVPPPGWCDRTPVPPW